MSSFETLLGQVSDSSNLVEVGVDDDFDFTLKDQIFLIESGSVLAYGEKDPETGIKATQTFGVHDPIGFTEAIAVRDIGLEFRKLSDLTLRKFDPAELRKQVNSANVFSKTIIKYSLSRIFDAKKSSSNFSFEEEFVNKQYRFLTRKKVAQDEEIFRVNSDAQKMFFIEKGLIGIVSRNNRMVADLSDGECFGEAALLSDRPRNYAAIARKDSSLLVIERSTVEHEMTDDSPLVRLSVLVLLKRLELMNKLRIANQI